LAEGLSVFWAVNAVEPDFLSALPSCMTEIVSPAGDANHEAGEIGEG
jgi:hypothetical protein